MLNQNSDTGTAASIEDAPAAAATNNLWIAGAGATGVGIGIGIGYWTGTRRVRKLAKKKGVSMGDLLKELEEIEKEE